MAVLSRIDVDPDNRRRCTSGRCSRTRQRSGSGGRQLAGHPRIAAVAHRRFAYRRAAADDSRCRRVSPQKTAERRGGDMTRQSCAAARLGALAVVPGGLCGRTDVLFAVRSARPSSVRAAGRGGPDAGLHAGILRALGARRDVERADCLPRALTVRGQSLHVAGGRSAGRLPEAGRASDVAAVPLERS